MTNMPQHKPVIVRLYISHWSGVYEEPTEVPSISPRYHIDIEEGDLGQKILQLAKAYDVTLVQRTYSSNDPKLVFKLRLDDFGRRFAQR